MSPLCWKEASDWASRTAQQNALTTSSLRRLKLGVALIRCSVPSGCVQKMLKAGGCLPAELENVLRQTCWTPTELIAHCDENQMPGDRANWCGASACRPSQDTAHVWVGWNSLLVSKSPENLSAVHQDRSVDDKLSW